MRIGFLILTATMMACGNKSVELATFETPQPNGKRDIIELPKKWEGRYIPLNSESNEEIVLIPSDSVDGNTMVLRTATTLQVKRNLIVQTVTSYMRSPESMLDSAERVIFKHDTTFTDPFSGDLCRYQIRGDSVFQDRYSYDTLFSKRRGDIVRKFRNYYFVNQKAQDGNWYVKRLNTLKGALIIGTISSTSDLDKLRLISEQDTIDNFKLTRKQFKEFVKANGFSNEDVFVRVEMK